MYSKNTPPPSEGQTPAARHPSPRLKAEAPHSSITPPLTNARHDLGRLGGSQETTVRLVFLRKRAVLTRTGISNTAMYEAIAAGTFPRSIALGARSVAWLEHEVEAWMAARVAQSRPPVGGSAQ